jgi:hypothetical protein
MNAGYACKLETPVLHGVILLLAIISFATIA